MERLPADIVKDFTIEDLYEIFIKTITNMSSSDLVNCTQSVVVDEEESVVGDMKVVYAYSPDYYLTFVITYVDETEMAVYNIEKEKEIGNFRRNKEIDGWSGMKKVELADETKVKISEVFDAIKKIKESIK